MRSRRKAIQIALAGAIAVQDLARAQISSTGVGSERLAAAQETACNQAIPVWPRGIEGQRKADFGDGRYLNPILPGDYRRSGQPGPLTSRLR